MKTRFHEIVKAISLKLYQFSYNTLPDDLQAQQVVIDALSAFMLKERELIEFVSLDETAPKRVRMERLLKAILPYAYDLGAKRYIQLEQHIKSSKDVGLMTPFYQLDVASRAILFMKYKWNFDYQEISQVTKLPKAEVIEKMFLGREIVGNDRKAWQEQAV